MTPSLAVVARHHTAPSSPAPAPAEAGTRLVSLVAPAPVGDPVRVFECARQQGRDAVLWHLPARREALVGIGAVATLTGTGVDRFAQVAHAWRALASTAVRLYGGGEGGPAEPHPVASETLAPGAEGLLDSAAGSLDGAGPAVGPVLMGGFAFAPGDHDGPWAAFGDARLWVPGCVYQVKGDRAWLHVQAQIPADADPLIARQVAEAELERMQASLAGALAHPSGDARDAAPAARAANGARSGRAADTACGPAEAVAGPGAVTRRDVPAKEQWLASVAAVVDAIRAGQLEKAVLARTVQVSAAGGFAPGAALRYLEKHYPECCIFAVAHGDQCFLGATPERLVRLEAGQVEVACLAGSIGRGRTPEEDRRLGAALLGSAKNRHEHQVVLDAIVAGLAPWCNSVAAAPEPVLLKFANVQHLYTPVRARLRNGATVLDLAATLHPTPAIGGHPTAKALAFIRRLEAVDRGWYAGPVGWVDGRGQGEFAVALRSALLAGEQAWLYAGCGIMADSDPEAEFAESCLKLRPMLAALGGADR